MQTKFEKNITKCAFRGKVKVLLQYLPFFLFYPGCKGAKYADLWINQFSDIKKSNLVCCQFSDTVSQKAIL